jgi:hypothetical protein
MKVYIYEEELESTQFFSNGRMFKLQLWDVIVEEIGGFTMRKVLAITTALLLAAIILMPAMGFTIKSASPYPYSIKAEPRPNFTISDGMPAHKMAVKEPVARTPRYSISSERVNYSFELLGSPEYTVKLITGAAKVAAAGKEGKAGEAPKIEEKKPAEKPLAEVKKNFSITGMAFEDVNGNGTKEADEKGLAGWEINLAQLPAGTVINKGTTKEDGSYAFAGLMPGSYAVTELVQQNWTVTKPADGKYMINLTDKDSAGNDFANKKVA